VSLAIPVAETQRRRRDFALQGVFWRRFVDWTVCNVPPVFHPPLIWLSAFACFFAAAPARKSLLGNLQIVLPGSWRLANCARVVRVFANFGWAMIDGAVHRLLKPRFSYEFDDGALLEQLASGHSAIVLTAHMGNYDLAAALFAEKFGRSIRMVRALEPDAVAAEHVGAALQQAGAGEVKVGYSNDGTALALDLLNALRNDEIISIQGDRVSGEVARAPVCFFEREVLLPSGPFVLSMLSETPIFPMFMVRTGWRKYKIIAREPIVCRPGGSKEERIADAMQRWARTLEATVKNYWPQWYAFVPIFNTD
jgi:lauroyl/myristoyl acyltransferase